MAEQLFEVVEPVAPTVLLDAVAAAEAAERREAVAKLEAVLAWAHAHPDTAASWAADRSMFTPPEEGEDRLGGEGTPPVAEFAVEQLATRLGISTGAAMQLVADTVNLAHRHPTLWERVRAGACPYAIAKWDPEKTRKAEEQARDTRRLDIDLPGHGARPSDVSTAAIRGLLSPTDAMKFDALVTAHAAWLADHGDTSSLDIRRSKALGAIADALMTGELDLTSAEEQDTQTPATRRRSCLPATLFVHVRLEDLLAHLSGEDRIGVAEKIGPPPP